jgi:wobble nucleotide-excising tRNase
MIKRINNIKNFGVFNNYKRSGDIQDFAKVNIIYGWNYSGKTTISRLFQCLEFKSKNADYTSCEFELEDYSNNKGNQNNLNINNHEIKVFNSDFIRDNIHLEGESFDPILLLGDDAKKAEEEIKLKDDKLNKIIEINRKLSKEYIAIENAIQTGLTQRASLIKETLQIVQAYTKTHLKPVFDSIKNNYLTHIQTDEKVSELLKNATASESDKLIKKDKFEVNIQLKNKLEETNILLNIVPEFSNTIQYFIDNPDVANWAELGVTLHKEKSKCEFCGNDLKEERINELLAHFSEDLKNHKKLLENLITSLNQSKLSNPTLQKSDFYKELWNDFQEEDKNLKKSIKDYNTQIDNLIILINKKKDKPFEKITDFISVSDNSDIVLQNVISFNEVITQNSKKTDDFEKTKTEAIETLKKHYAAKFIDEIKIEIKENKINLYKSREANYNQLKETISAEIKTLEATISKAHKGKEVLNEYIAKFLGRDEIKVVVVKEGEKERFKLKRSDSKAVNLSEGEKTAIAFSFFLTKLLECKDFTKTIVYIDDPISSLDSNHIFQVNALLKDFFFSKEKPVTENSSTVLNCLQLFLSTHNFDFFNLLRELPKPKESNKFYYYVKRINENESIIDKLPKSLENYSSEYHYLFELIYNFNNSEIKDFQILMGIPNAVRRFVELYTYSRIPANTSSTVDNRAELLWGTEKSKRILKVFHYFSHANNIERIIKHSDLMCDIENAVSDLVDLIKLDALHYNELEKAIKK